MRQLTRTLDIFDHLAVSGDASLAEVTAAIGAPRASVHRLLAALAERGYVEHSSEGAVYRLGPAIRNLAASSTESLLVQIAAPALTDLRAKTGESVNLAILDGSRIVYVAALDGIYQPRMSAFVGSEVEPHATALGKAILSLADEQTRRRVLPSEPFPVYTDATITGWADLELVLEAAARRGFAVEIEESTLSSTCIAVPILDVQGHAFAALSVSGVPARLPVDSHEAVARSLQVWAERITEQLVSRTATNHGNGR